MPFPADLEALEAAGYVFARAEVCPDCRECVEVWTTPGKREIVMDPMHQLVRPAIRHYETCKPPVPITMHSVSDKNMVACGWQEGTLAVQFRFGLYHYANVPENIFVTLRKNPYPNNYFTKVVKNHPELYPFTKVA